jgi:oligopeptide/dipeptide ABC transporter ATP-binding protein
MLLQVRNLTKHFDLGHGRVVHALDGVSMDVAEGTILGLVGESGSGKSTLGKTVVGLLDKTDGEVVYRGATLARQYRSRDFRRLSKQMQMIFQDPYSSLNPRLTVGELVAEPLRLVAAHSTAAVRARVAEWLHKVGLSPNHTGRYPHELSGGQRQRVGIARALIVEPRLVICDEAVSALDVSVQAQVANLLLDLKESMSLTLVFIAHDLAMVRQLADRVAVMYLGVLVEDGPAEAVYREPAHPYTQALIGAIPEPDPRRERLRRHTPITGEIASPIDLPPGCRFAARCPSVMARCRAEVPQLLPAGAERRVACHLVAGH